MPTHTGRSKANAQSVSNIPKELRDNMKEDACEFFIQGDETGVTSAKLVKSVDNLVKMAKRVVKKNPHIRYGQALMNVLGDMDMDLYRHITEETVCDPFHNDKFVDAFLACVKVEWEKPQFDNRGR